jgi:hypothetical protein
VYMPVYGSPLTQRTGAVNPEGEVE